MIVRPQEKGAATRGLGAALVDILNERRDRPTLIRFRDGKEVLATNAMRTGRDIGDMWEHIIIDPLPSRPDGGCIFFYLSDVVSLIDPDTRRVLAEQTPAPGEQ